MTTSDPEMRASVAAMMARPLPPRKRRTGSAPASPASPHPPRPPTTIRDALLAAKVCLEGELAEVADLPPTNSFYVRVERICDALDLVMDALGERGALTWRERVALEGDPK
jgi:hypothetical protein